MSKSAFELLLRKLVVSQEREMMKGGLRSGRGWGGEGAGVRAMFLRAGGGPLSGTGALIQGLACGS